MANKNPFHPVKEFSFWSDWENLKRYHKFFEHGAISEIGEYERDTLVPKIFERLDHFENLFAKIKTTCADKSVAADLDAVLRQILNPSLVKLGLPPPAVGLQYLAAVNKMVDENFLAPISEIKTKYGARTFESIEPLIDFLNRTNYLCSSITETRDVLFSYNFKGFPIIKNLQTQEEIVGIPADLKVSLFPFEIILQDLFKSADTMRQSIDLWSKQRQDKKKDFFSFISQQAQIRLAKTLNRFQILVIVFTLALVFGADVLEEKWANRQLENKIEKIRLENERLNTVEQKQNTLVKDLTEKIGDLEAKLKTEASRKGRQ